MTEKKLLPLAYCSIKRASELLSEAINQNVTVGDIQHWLQIGVIRGFIKLDQNLVYEGSISNLAKSKIGEFYTYSYVPKDNNELYRYNSSCSFLFESLMPSRSPDYVNILMCRKVFADGLWEVNQIDNVVGIGDDDYFDYTALTPINSDDIEETIVIEYHDDITSKELLVIKEDLEDILDAIRNNTPLKIKNSIDREIYTKDLKMNLKKKQESYSKTQEKKNKILTFAFSIYFKYKNSELPDYKIKSSSSWAEVVREFYHQIDVTLPSQDRLSRQLSPYYKELTNLYSDKKT